MYKVFAWFLSLHILVSMAVFVLFRLQFFIWIFSHCISCNMVCLVAPLILCGFFCSLLNQNADLFLKVGLLCLVFSHVWIHGPCEWFCWFQNFHMLTEAHSWEWAMAINLDIGKLVHLLLDHLESCCSKSKRYFGQRYGYWITMDDFDWITRCPLPYKCLSISFMLLGVHYLLFFPFYVAYRGLIS